MRSVQVPSILALVLLAASPSPGLAADRAEIRDLLLTAREKFADVVGMRAVYFAKLELAEGVFARTNYRREVEANIQNLKITVDGFPARRTNLQEEVYRAWLAGRAERTEVDRQIGVLNSQMKEIDEMVLAQAAMNGKRPGASNRRDILFAFPEAEKQCMAALDSLRAAVAGATQNAQEGERLVQELNAELTRSGQGDGRFGPPAEFFVAYRKYKRQAPTAPARPKSKTSRKK